MPSKKELGRVRRKDDRGRASQSTLERREDYEGKESLPIYYALRRLLKETGWIDDTWWFAARRSDVPFVKEGRAIIAPNTWDEIRLTAPRRGAILVTRVDFRFPERIGRRFVELTLRYDNEENMLGYESEASGGGPPGPMTIYSTILHDRWLINDGKVLAFRMNNTSLVATAVVDFVIRGRRIGGGHRMRIR